MVDRATPDSFCSVTNKRIYRPAAAVHRADSKVWITRTRPSIHDGLSSGQNAQTGRAMDHLPSSVLIIDLSNPQNPPAPAGLKG